MQPIGRVQSCFSEKFGTPRQSGIIPEAKGRVLLNKAVPEDACRGLEEFSHLWIVFLFHQVLEKDTRWLVRPPRLGGNDKKGVFATRSPFRPNRIGLSLVKLEAVHAHSLEVSGLDLIDGTPVLDLKPYLPYVEALAEAEGGFAETAPLELNVHFPDGEPVGWSLEHLALVKRVLALDPRPAYHKDPSRIYGCVIHGENIKWRVEKGQIIVLTSDS